MLVVGLTGGIGSGKSTVAALFAELGVEVIDADEVAREVVQPGTTTLQQLVDAFGHDILDEQGTLNRRRLRERVFADESERKQLEAIVHPAIRERTRELLYGIAERGAAYCINVVPLLFETGLDQAFDRVLVVDATPDLQIERSVTRDGSSRATIERILEAQIARSERNAGADDLIENTGSQAELRAEVERLHRLYTELGTGTARPAYL